MTPDERRQMIEQRGQSTGRKVRLWVRDGWRDFEVVQVPVEALMLNVDNRRFAAERTLVEEKLGHELDPENSPDNELALVNSHMSGYYEQPEVAAKYAEFHFGETYFNVPNFPAACVERALELAPLKLRKRALDLGCGPGRSTFELSRHFDTVDGVDLSSSFICIARRLANTGRLDYQICAEGDIWLRREFLLESIGLHANDIRIRFHCADACHLSDEFSEYDLIFAGNLLDRLRDPSSFLLGMATRMRAEGVLVIASPYVWSTEFTPSAMWLSHTTDSGKYIYSFDSICELLLDEFELVCPPFDVPFVMRETKRVYQHTISEMTIWRRRM